MSKVLWIRHGATEWNVTGRYLGGTDLSMTDEGDKEVRQLGKVYRQAPITRIYCSPLKRAQETADILSKRWKCDIVLDERLKELHFGAWEGLTTEEIQHRYPRLWREWVTLSVRGPFPGGGESFAVMHRRVGAFIKEHLTPPPEQPIAVITHGGVLRSAMVHLLSLPTNFYWAFQFGRASATCSVHQDKRVSVEYLNRCYSADAHNTNENA